MPLTYGRAPARYAASPCGPPFRKALTGASPHRITAIERNNHGIHARVTREEAWIGGATVLDCAGRDEGDESPSNSKTSLGFHTRMNKASARIDSSPPAMSTSSTPTKLLHRYCTSANVPPHTSTAGHTPRNPRHPLMVTTSHAGTITDTKGNWRPAIAPRVAAGIPVTAASVRIGVPIAPNATGAVLAMSDSPAAYSGVNPRPINNAEQIATGVPNPDAPSMNAPNDNATSSAWIRRSFDRRPTDPFTMSN